MDTDIPNMDTNDRLREAIKQIDIAIEDTDQNDVLRELDEGRVAIEKSRELLDELEA